MKLDAVCADLHVFEGEVKWATPLRLALRFDDGSSIRLRVGGDGETMVADRLPLEGPFDMEEYGRVEIFDITDRLEPTLRGSRVGEPGLIHDGGGRAIGLALPRLDAATFCFWVDGDELHWGSEAGLFGHDWLTETTPTLGGLLKL